MNQYRPELLYTSNSGRYMSNTSQSVIPFQLNITVPQSMTSHQSMCLRLPTFTRCEDIRPSNLINYQNLRPSTVANDYEILFPYINSVPNTDVLSSFTTLNSSQETSTVYSFATSTLHPY